jgi:hypothetical protein
VRGWTRRPTMTGMGNSWREGGKKFKVLSTAGRLRSAFKLPEWGCGEGCSGCRK